MNNNIRKMAIGLISSFVILIGYLSYINLYSGPKVLGHYTNKRTVALEKETQRGKIIDSSGTVLAQSVTKGAGYQRQYPYGALYSYVVGYDSQKYGRTGIEAAFNGNLLGMQGTTEANNVLRRLEGKPPQGDDVTLTLRHDLQSLGYQLLGNRRGAIVLMSPQDGSVQAMVSTPSYDANQVEELWAQLTKSEAGLFLNRATQGLYPPGSTLKVMTAAGALQKLPNITSRHFSCPGYLQIGNYRLGDLGVHGDLNLTEALVKSCNTTFGELGIELGSQNMLKLFEQFGFGHKWPLPIPGSASRPPAEAGLSKSVLAQTAIGQGDVLATPLHMALITSAIANQGDIPKPQLVAKITNPQGQDLWNLRGEKLMSVMTPEEAIFLQQAMTGVVERGTGRSAQIPGIKVAGKTGSAENPHGQAHAWFIGFAPAERPKYVIAVIVENAGFGGREAAPIAQKMLKQALQS